MPVQRVAVVSDYSMATAGGAETAFFEQVRILGRHANVLALSVACPRLDELGGCEGVTAVAVPCWFRVARLGFPVARNTARLRRFFVEHFTRHGTEVVHLHSELGIAAAAMEAARELGLPVVHTVHTFFWQTDWPIQPMLALMVPALHRFATGLTPTRESLADAPGDSALRNLTLAFARGADQVISPSAHQAARLRASGLERVSVVPNAMAPIAGATVPAAVDPPLRVLWVGRMFAIKRILPFVAAVRAALDELGPGRLAVDIVGDGEQLSRAKRLAGCHPAITFHGRCRPEQVHRLLIDCHVTALTSVGWDNQPMVVVESVSALRGVIYCDPALTEGLDGPGIPAFGTDIAALTDVLVRLASDPSAVLAASRAAVTARGEFSEETFVGRVAEVYSGALLASGR